MIVIDTSAWIEFLRDTGSPTCEAVDRLLDAGIAITDAVSMEVLASARDDIHLQSLRRLLARASVLPTTPATYEHAATLCADFAAIARHTSLVLVADDGRT